jgi:hypothetical protein
MIKAVVLLRRPETWTRERFQRWWLDEHAPYVKKLLITEEYALLG